MINRTVLSRLLIIVFTLASGCRHASVKDDPNWPNPGPVDVASLPPIHSVINQGTTDPDTMLAVRQNVPAAVNTAQQSQKRPGNPIMLGSVSEAPQAGNTPEAVAVQPPQNANLPATPAPTFAENKSLDNVLPAVPPQVAAAPVQESATSNLAQTPQTPPQASSTQPVVNQLIAMATPPAAAAIGQSANSATQPLPAELPPGLPPAADPTIGQAQSAQVQATVPPPASLASPANTLPSATQPNLTTQKVDNQAQKTAAPGGPVSGPAAKALDQSQEFSLEGLSPTAVSAGRVAANVGREIITVYDLNIAVQDWIRLNVPAGQTIPRRDGLMIARLVLNQMVDRMLIVQEAHRLMKSEKQKEALMKQIDQVWTDQQIPPLMKKYKVETVYDLEQEMRKKGRTLEAAKKDFMNDAVAHEFMGMKLNGKTYVSLVEMRRYYNNHMAEFDRPAQLTWREIRVPVESGDKNAAEQKMLAILKKIQSGSDFATLAKQEGKGPTADQGGLWETSPGGFALPEINKALETLQQGQVSGVIMTAQAAHIIRLETRREAGPARFDEVQTEIQTKLRNEKLAEASIGFVSDLRKNTVVTTIFDSMPQLQIPGSPADKQVQKVNAASATFVGTSPQTKTQPSAQTAQPSAQTLPSGLGDASSSGSSTSGSASSKHLLRGNGSSTADDKDDPPPALAPSGPKPQRGVMSGTSAPSPL